MNAIDRMKAGGPFLIYQKKRETEVDRQRAKLEKRRLGSISV